MNISWRLCYYLGKSVNTDIIGCAFIGKFLQLPVTDIHLSDIVA